MDKKRKEARDKLNSIRTKQELLDYLDLLTITDEEKQIAFEIYALGYSHTRIAIEHNLSIEKSKHIIQKVLDKVLI